MHFHQASYRTTEWKQISLTLMSFGGHQVAQSHESVDGTAAVPGLCTLCKLKCKGL